MKEKLAQRYQLLNTLLEKNGQTLTSIGLSEWEIHLLRQRGDGIPMEKVVLDPNTTPEKILEGIRGLQTGVSNWVYAHETFALRKALKAVGYIWPVDHRRKRKEVTPSEPKQLDTLSVLITLAKQLNPNQKVELIKAIIA